MSFPINNKQDLINALAGLNESELEQAGLQKKGTIDTSTPEGREARDKQIQQLKEEAELRKKIFDAQGDLQRSNRASLEIQNQLLEQLNLKELALTDINNLDDEQKKIVEEIKKLTDETVASVDDLKKLQEDNNRKLKISNKEGEKYRNTFESIATHIGMSNKGAAKLVNSTKKLAESLKDNEEKQAEFARAFVSQSRSDRHLLQQQNLQQYYQVL